MTHNTHNSTLYPQYTNSTIDTIHRQHTDTHAHTQAHTSARTTSHTQVTLSPTTTPVEEEEEEEEVEKLDPLCVACAPLDGGADEAACENAFTLKYIPSIDLV